MTLLSIDEKKLKDQIENMGTGGPNKAMLSGLTLKAYGDQIKGLTYDEAISLANENELTMSHMSAMDPAFEFMANSMLTMLKVAEALNNVNCLGRHEHQLPVHALVSVGDTAVECNFHISRVGYTSHRRKELIIKAIRQEISTSSDWAGSHRHPSEIDYVEL